MVSIASVADRWRTDEFLLWDSGTETFSGSIFARMFRVDRFKSIYTRPVHRAQITLDPAVAIPSSFVVKQVSTGFVYMVSNIRRQDAIDGTLYDGIVTLHLASGGSGSYATHYRYAVAGSGDDLGPLVQTQLASTYLDMELRTSSADPDAHDLFVGHYFVTTPATSDLQVDDVLIHQGDEYRVDEVYFDSGYLMARAAKEDYDKVNLTYHLPQGSGGSYNAATDTLVPETVADRVFTGAVTMHEVTDSEESLTGPKMLDVAVGVDHIGFTPEVEHTVTYDGELYKVSSARVASDRKQWLLTLRGVS